MSQGLIDKKHAVVHISSIPEPSAPQSAARTRNCLTRKFLWFAALAMVLIVAVGVGAGIGLHNASSTATTATASATVAAITTQSSSTRGMTSTTMSATTTSTAARASGTASTSCPGSNGTTYTAAGHTFLVLCTNDIQAPNKVDLGRVYQPTFDACIDSCANLDSTKRSDISAVYWVDYNTEETGTCWCFGNTSRSDGAYVSTWAANNLAWIQS